MYFPYHYKENMEKYGNTTVKMEPQKIKTFNDSIMSIIGASHY